MTSAISSSQSRKKRVEGGIQCDGGRWRRRQPFLSSQSGLLPERKEGPATVYCMSSDNFNHFETFYESWVVPAGVPSALADINY